MNTSNGLPAITCKELRQLERPGKKHLVIDVREAADFEAGHIDGSRHVPFAELEANLPSIVHDKAELVVIVGEKVDQAQETFNHMRKAGYKHVKFLLGGFDAWCKPAKPDIDDVLEEMAEDKELSEDASQHGEDINNVEQGTQDEPLL